MRTTFLIPTLVSLLSHIHGADATGQRVGCFGSVPSSYVSQGTNIYQSSDKCSSACSSYDFFAMTQGNECYCGSSYPSSVDGSNACSVACVGYPAENCGGSSAFVVMAQAGVDLSSYSNAASSSSAASSESPSSSSSSSTPASSSLSPSTTVSSASSSASSRRLSDGSLADATDYAKKVLRVANPDDEQSVYNHH
ncbi:hypothetical protein PICMEDRAFT_142929 [Pichia membranifaciens NRRL Y-2026]|uniref:WSC domain-containing protein n=1 Tax=Pichia membranifaciens NRRL Y-2026 TaxID=763406 RepID=A0A1E3NHN0_9ASCO|nr:hypothetical protein PICMEDRAFT_142929 [Pichia membranifaciens NRRL Y-2026]ODQ45642.1 hypothetical protein PICMEDRAFT_142929 [Pichia membranifaciens NRRL Y-2026]